jgi:flagellar hook-length control protein FliK
VPTGSLLEQVTEQLPQAISKGSGRIRLNLIPDSLGRLDMDLIVRENRVQIVLTAESRTVQQSLQGHVDQLKDALQQQGLEVDGFNVFLQNDRRGQGDPAAGGNPFWGEYRQAATNNNGAEQDGLPATITPFAAGPNRKQGVEGINIFI